MTPEEFTNQVLPNLKESVQEGCLCSSDGFRKVVSFNFEDYRFLNLGPEIAPTGLADSEILIQEFIRTRYISERSKSPSPSVTIQVFQCPVCRSKCIETYSEYSISMNRSYVKFF